MLSCKDTTKLISDAMEGNLSARHRISLWVHLCLCSICRRFRTNVIGLRTMVRALGDSENVPPPERSLTESAKERMRDALDKAS